MAGFTSGHIEQRITGKWDMCRTSPWMEGRERAAGYRVEYLLVTCGTAAIHQLLEHKSLAITSSLSGCSYLTGEFPKILLWASSSAVHHSSAPSSGLSRYSQSCCNFSLATSRQAWVCFSPMNQSLFHWWFWVVTWVCVTQLRSGRTRGSVVSSVKLFTRENCEQQHHSSIIRPVLNSNVLHAHCHSTSSFLRSDDITKNRLSGSTLTHSVHCSCVHITSILGVLTFSLTEWSGFDYLDKLLACLQPRVSFILL